MAGPSASTPDLPQLALGENPDGPGRAIFVPSTEWPHGPHKRKVKQMDYQSGLPPHSAAWIAFTQVNFAVIALAVTVGLWNLAGDLWIRGFFTIGVLALVAATVTMTKTLRDVHESKRH